MRIGIFTDCFFPNIGGAEIVVHQLATTLKRMGEEVHVIVPLRKGRPPKVGYPIYRYPLPPANSGVLRTAFQGLALCYYAKRFNLDVINIHKTYGGYSAAKFKKLLNVPVVITAHGGDIQKVDGLSYGRRLQGDWEEKIRTSVKSADGLIAVSRESVDRFIDLGADRNQIFEIPNGVDLHRFKEKPKSPKDIGLKKGDEFILAVGRYHVKKGYEHLLNSFAALAKKRSKTKLVIVGKDLEALKPLVHHLRISSRVCFVQEQKGSNEGILRFPNDTLLWLYQNARLFVSSSIIEGFALVCVEAVAAGLPVVLTQCPGNEDVLPKDGEGGFYVPVGAEVALAEKMKTVLEDLDLQKSWKTKNMDLAEKRYDWGVVARAYLDLFKSQSKTARI